MCWSATQAGRDPLNGDLTEFVGELSTRSPQFRRNWAEHDVHEHRTGQKIYRHSEVGDLHVSYDVLEMPGEHGLSITTYSAEEGSSTAEKFSLLASWAASRQPPAASHESDTTPVLRPQKK
ncbi:hypothetical protein [Streptomyces sp. NRRL S-1824]|uniref:MmyB family transcriptional regulator n=1 Tax=Streptomyces sp. NRRL S-1824 TaxID=1463889 RepID=UPI00131C6026|nr:hypothetical protein [Streptomyces sp. NRRL S-1824]